MQGRIIAVRQISGAEELAWRDLAGRAAEPNPFLEPDCVIPAARYQTFGAEIHLVVAEEAGRWYACVPARAVRRWKFPYPIVTSQVRRMGNLGTPLVDASRATEAMTVVLRALAEHRRVDRGRIFVLDTAAADGPVAGFVREAARGLHFPLAAFESYERGFLVRRADASYELSHSAKSRHKLRQKRRQLERHVVGDVVLVDRSDDPSAIDEYVDLEAAGYKRRIGVAMTTVPGEPEYFSDMCRRFAASGRLHLLALEAGGRTVAMELLFRGGEGLILTKIAYDEDYARYSPGILLQTEGIPYLLEHTDAQWIDSGTSPDNELLLRLYTDRRQIEMLFIVLGRNALDRAVVKAFLLARPVHKWSYGLRHRDPGPPGAAGRWAKAPTRQGSDLSRQGVR